jgi:hypothetical protein
MDALFSGSCALVTISATEWTAIEAGIDDGEGQCVCACVRGAGRGDGRKRSLASASLRKVVGYSYGRSGGKN